MLESNDRTRLRLILATYFNESELRTLCFDLGIDYEELAGQEKRAKARELVSFCERHNRIDDLIVRCRQERPAIPWWENNDGFIPKSFVGGILYESLQGGGISVTFPKLFMEDVKLLAHNFHEKTFGRRYKQTFNPFLYAERADEENHLERFLASDQRVLVITGKAGMGKSNIVCSITQKWQQRGNIVFLEDCAYPVDLRSLPPLARDLSKNEGLIDLVDLWSDDFSIQDNSNFSQGMILVFDAIDEALHPEELLQRISHCITFNNLIPFKVIIVCRDPSWRFLKDSLQIPQTYIYEVFPLVFELHISEFSIEESYAAYRNHAAIVGFSQDYEELSLQAKDFIRYPLFLGLAIKTFGGTNNLIPKHISLRQLFNQYVNDSIGSAREDPRHLIVERMMIYLYELRQRAIDVGILRTDSVIGDYIKLTGHPLPYQRLVDGGFITHEQKYLGTQKEYEQAFITYERVFEFLLADLVLNPHQPISSSDIESIIQSSPIEDFPSFIGALELALSYRIIDSPVQRMLIIQLASSNNALTRQLVQDILHTIDSENPEFAEQIVREMCFQSDTNTRITACNISYDLGLYEQLIALSMSKDQLISYTASYYIYRLWDEARQQGRLDDGYKLLKALAEESRYPRVLKTRLLKGQRALTALFSVSAHMLKHLLSTPESLSPLGNILGDTLRSLPGLENESPFRVVLNSVSEMLTLMGIQLVSILTFRPDVIFSNKNAMDAFYQEKENGEAIMRMFHSVLDYPTLKGHEQEILEIMNQAHPIVPWLSSGVLIFHCLDDFEGSLDVLEYIFDHGNFHCRFWVTYVLEATCMIHISKGSNSYVEILPFLYDFALAMWDDREDPELSNLATGAQVDTSEILLLVEAMQHRFSGTRMSPGFLEIVLREIDTPLNSADVKLILNYCELVAYQGYPEYSLHLLFSGFYSYWEKFHRKEAIRILSAVRSIFREEFDAFRNKTPALERLWGEIQNVGATANINSLWHANANIWLIGMYSSKTLLKAAYLGVMSLIDATSTNDFFRRMVRLALELIRNPTEIDELVVRRHLKDNVDWARNDFWEISNDTLNKVRQDFGRLT